MKRALLVLCILLLTAACGGSDPTATPAATSAPPQSEPTAASPADQEPTAPADDTDVAQPTPTQAAAPTTEPTAAPTIAPTSAPSPTTEPTAAEPTAVEPTAAATQGATPVSTEPAAEATESPAATGPLNTDAEAQELRYKFERGQSFEEEVALSFTIDAPGQAGTVPGASVETRMDVSVRSVEDGDATLVVTYRDVRTSQGGGRTVEVPRASLRQLRQTVRVDARGQTLAQEGGTTTGLQTSPAPGAASPFGPVLAEEAVAPGDTWTVRQKANASGATTTVTTEYTLLGYVEQDGRELAQIRMEFRVPRTEIQQNGFFSGTGTQTYLFDPEAGHMVSMEGDMSGNLELQVGSGPVQKAKANYEYSATFEEKS
jgi:hypothetical protein